MNIAEMCKTVDEATVKIAALQAKNAALEKVLSALVSNRHGHPGGWGRERRCQCPWCAARVILAAAPRPRTDEPELMIERPSVAE